MLDSAAREGTSDTELTEQLVAIWTEALQTSVGLHDAFLDLGGDSLAAMQCIVRMRDAFAIEFTIDDFLAGDATVASFAGKIAEMM